MYNKTIIRFGFCDIQNNQGLGKGYQPEPAASADNPYSTLIILDITKTSSNNWLLWVREVKKQLSIGRNSYARFKFTFSALSAA